MTLVQRRKSSSTVTGRGYEALRIYLGLDGSRVEIAPPSRKSWKHSRAGTIDRWRVVGQLTGMILRNTISSWIKAIALTAFAFALVFFPPSASHAASGMHSDHHVVAAGSDQSMSGHDHGEMPSIDVHTKQGTPTTDAKDDASTGTCCNGFCLSVVLLENAVIQRDVAATRTYRMPAAQARSLVAHGFLRPPQFLI